MTLDSTRYNLDGSVCCGNEAWRGRLCDYHQGYEDGTQPDFDGIAWVHDNPVDALIALENAGLVVKRWMVPESPHVDPERNVLRTWRITDDPTGWMDLATEVWVRVDTLPPLIGEETEEGTDDE